MMLMLAAGCAHVHVLRDDDPATSAAFERHAVTEAAVITLVDGTRHEAKLIRLGDIETTWTDAKSDTTMTVATADIEKIAFGDGTRAAANAAGLSFLVFGTTGAVIGYRSGSDHCHNEAIFCMSRTDGAVLGGFLLGFPAAIIGGIIGGTHGASEVYYPNPELMPDPDARGEFARPH